VVSGPQIDRSELERRGLSTWKSPRLEAFAYRKLTVVNWIAEYRLMYLKQLKLVTSEARPSL
jgi:hypothetical protein